jgi:hypothetical protein
LPVTWEEIVSVAVPLFAIAGLLGIGYSRDWRSRAAFRAFTQRHGLAYEEGHLTQGVLPHGQGKVGGKDLYVGYVWVKPFTEGIGPTYGGKSIAVVALTIGSTALIDREAPVVREFLNSNGSLTEKTVTYSFPRRRFKAIRLEELDAAFALVRQVAATATGKYSGDR